MDNAQSNSPSSAHQGGIVEPATTRPTSTTGTHSASPLKAKPGERFEMRDPFEEVTYRAGTMKEIMAKAEQLGSHRFTAIDSKGQRTFVQKSQDGWQRTERLGTIPDLDKSSATPMRELSAAQTSADRNGAKSQSIAKSSNADRSRRIEQIEAALNDRYLIKHAPVTLGAVSLGQTEYRFRGDTSRIAFTESTFKLATDTNSPSVARSMVDVAEARGWRSLRISGAEEFRRMVWMEASIRGVKTQGYEPVPGDVASMRKEQLARQINQLEPLPTPGSSAQAPAQGTGSRKTVLAAIEALLVAKGVPEQKREAVLAAATEQLAQAKQNGQTAKVRVLDKSAPSHRPVPALIHAPEQQRQQAARTR